MVWPLGPNRKGTRSDEKGIAYKLLVVVVEVASREWNEEKFENFCSLMEVVLASKETT